MAEPAPRPVDEIADRYVDECVARYPETATYLGVDGNDDNWSDYSPTGLADQIAHVDQTIADLQAATPVDRREELAKDRCWSGSAWRSSSTRPTSASLGSA